MAKYSEDFCVATWDKNGGSCSVSANATAAPDGNSTADQITASTATPVLQQQVAGLVSGGQQTFYAWAKVASGSRKVSLAIVDNGYASHLAGPTQVTLTTSWQRFNITGTLAGGQTGLWVVCASTPAMGMTGLPASSTCGVLAAGQRSEEGYARTWASQTGSVAAGIACDTAKDNSESPLLIFGPGSNLADHRLLEITSGGELILAGGTGNGDRRMQIALCLSRSGQHSACRTCSPEFQLSGFSGDALLDSSGAARQSLSAVPNCGCDVRR